MRQGDLATIRRGLRRPLLLLALAAALVWPTSAPLAEQTGTATGLPVPRYVSLKTDRVNLREGPSKEHATTWVFQRAGLPVEITAEFETWRKVRDSEGAEGWVLHSLLSGRRTALVAPWKKTENFQIFTAPREIWARIFSSGIAMVSVPAFGFLSRGCNSSGSPSRRGCKGSSIPLPF